MVNYYARYLTLVEFLSSLAGPRQTSERRIKTTKPKGTTMDLISATKGECQEESQVCLKKVIEEENLHLHSFSKKWQLTMSNTEYIPPEDSHLQKKPKVYRSNKGRTGLHLKVG